MEFSDFMRDLRYDNGDGTDVRQAYKKNVWVYACVRAIFNGQNTVPWYLRDERTQERVKKTNPWQRLFLNPNPLMECMQVWKMHTILFETKGESFWLLFDAYMKPVALNAVPDSMWVYGPDKVTPWIDTDTQTFKGWKYKARLDREEYQYFRPWQVLRFFDVDPDNVFRALAPIEPASMSIKVQGKAMGFNESYLDNGAKVDGVINIDAETYQAMGEEGLEAMQERFADRYGGYRKNGKTPIIAGGDFKPTGSGPKDMDFQNLSEWTREEIIGAFGVPELLVGLTKNLNMATSQEEIKMFFTNNVIPKLDYCASVINNKLLLGTGVEFYWDKHAIKALQDALDSKVANAVELVTVLGYSTNEVNRKLELGMDEIKEKWADTPVDPRTLNQAAPTVPPGKGSKKSEEMSDPELISLSADRDVAMEYWNDVVRPVENRMRPKIVSYWLRMKKDQLERFDSKFGKEASVLSKSFEDDLQQAMFDSEKWDNKLRSESLPFHQQAFTNSVAHLREEIDTFYVFKPGSEKVAALLAQKNSRITGVNDTFKESLLASLAEGVKLGESIPVLRGRIVTQFSAKIDTANTIARTETAQAAGMVRHMAMEDEGLLKRWVSAHDGHERSAHLRFNNLPAKSLNYEYAKGLKFPCDPDCSDAAQVCNCRCFEKAERRPEAQ